ncbi:MAG: hypothetical protein KDA96_14885 [Planctomycetaceae bacterium]|nr:hypothetical protein [Planctomycetaceae bacterium]
MRSESRQRASGSFGIPEAQHHVRRIPTTTLLHQNPQFFMPLMETLQIQMSNNTLIAHEIIDCVCGN